MMKRYSCEGDPHEAEMVECEYGEYVLLEDVKAQSEEAKSLKAELKINKVRNVFGTKNLSGLKLMTRDGLMYLVKKRSLLIKKLGKSIREKNQTITELEAALAEIGEFIKGKYDDNTIQNNVDVLRIKHTTERALKKEGTK